MRVVHHLSMNMNAVLVAFAPHSHLADSLTVPGFCLLTGGAASGENCGSSQALG